jgi:hypothetical protein
MPTLADAVDTYLRAMQQAQTPNDIAAATPPLLPLVQTASPDELTYQLRRLYVEIREASLPMVAITSLVCGGMVEHGGDPEVCGPLLLDYLGKLLGELREYWDQVRARTGAILSRENAMYLGEQCFNDIAQTHLNPAWAFYFHMPLAMGVIAHLSKMPALRATARSRPEVLAEAPNLDMISREDETYLTCMFRVLDGEPLLVLHPDERKGYEVRITAVADVLQLDTLLAANLIGATSEGWLQGRRPSEEIISAVTNGPVRFDLSVDGVFNLWTWNGLRPDGSLPVGLTPSEFLLPWNAFPDQITPFDGVRVLLLGKRFPPQNWQGTRRYRDMPGSLTVERTLPAEEVSAWLTRLTAARGG